MKRLYDYLEKLTPDPQDSAVLRDGANDWDYVAEMTPQALSMYAETGCLKHPYDQSERRTSTNLRALRLRIDANGKYVASVLYDVWEQVKGELDVNSPFYRAVAGYVLPPLERIAQGGWPLSRYPTSEIVADPLNDRFATEGEIFSVCVMDSGLYFVQFAYQFVRLLKASRQTQAVRMATGRAEAVLAEARAEIGRHIDLDAFEFFDCDTLAKVQIGGGLIVLNSILQGRAA